VVLCLADPTYMGYQNSVDHHSPSRRRIRCQQKGNRL
jgi:hypothetical protein